MKQLLVGLGFVLVLAAPALAQMPDVSQMSGMPLPTGDLPAGSVSVRVVRGDMSNNVVGQPVELHGAGATRTVSTDDAGRATFSGLTPGASVHAVATVDGQRLESQEFAVPASGGMRLILVAPKPVDAGAPVAPAAPGTPAAPAAPAQPGTVTLGSQSRFLVEVTEEMVEFYALLELSNGQAAPVQPEKPIVFTAPGDAGNMTLLEGSSPQAKAEGKTITVTGPFPPGRTIVQFAYQVKYDGATVAIRQPLPIALSQTSLLVRKVQQVTFTSPQTAEQRETPIDGQVYYVATGPGLAAGAALEVALDNLPHHSPLPRYLAVFLAVAVIAVGVWMTVSDPTSVNGQDRRSLESRREQLLGELVKLEAQHLRGHHAGKRYVPRRQDLMTQLAEVYARLDELDALPASPGGGDRAPVPVDAPLRTHRA